MELISPHNLPSDFQLDKVWETQIGLVYFFNDLVVFEAHEGVIVSYKTAFSVLEEGINYLGEKNWSFVSNRVNSYSIKPMDYKYLHNISSLKSVAVVYYNEIAKSNAIMESKFCKKPFKVFDNLLEAAVWGKGFLIV
ncbi:hypothetical protein QRD02_06590 [Aequorivita sp. SDUM287046]|uniref:Uncharacterized protein n=1 Tax=Aequorivita aurantiaca TaxID=3053356 RepID=A0ABT8DH11_9FLAO|nr:hypothetical protein [Aequorivita aurantiaca]MDN3724044.1 hypothetical protein [Aequorivita aurantiaca]